MKVKRFMLQILSHCLLEIYCLGHLQIEGLEKYEKRDEELFYAEHHLKK